MIKITAKQDGFRRAGAAHPAQTMEYPDGHWSPEQLVILQAEPMLTVQVLEGGKPKDVPPRQNIQNTMAAIAAATTVEELNKLAEGEDRKTVLPAIDARRAELEKE